MQKRGLLLNINTKCNFSCAYCYQANSLTTGKTISVEVLQRVRKLLSRNHTITFIQIFGGEPLLSQDILEKILDIVCIENSARSPEFYIYVSIVTNGSIFPSETLRRYRDLVSYQISIDGGATMHNMYRRSVGGFGTYTTVINNIKRFYDNGILFSLHSVITDVPKWRRSLPRLQRDLDGIPVTYSYNWKMGGTGSVIRDIYNYIYLHLHKPKSTEHFTIVSAFASERTYISTCNGGEYFLAMNSEGKLHSCEVEFDTSPMGSLNEDGYLVDSQLLKTQKYIAKKLQIGSYRVQYLPATMSRKLLTSLQTRGYTICNWHNKSITSNEFTIPIQDLFRIWIYARKRDEGV